MQSIIIVGEIENVRKKAQELISADKISKFDVDIIISEKSIGIADIRNLQKKIFLKPAYSEKKAVILEIFLGATVDAQNAFLKALEEPPANTIIYILTASLDFILPTVLSRCNLIDVSEKEKLNNNTKDYSEILNSICDKKFNPLILAQEYGKDKETALTFLQDLIIQTEKILNNNPKLSKYIKNFQKTYTLIKSTNVNVRFALENLFLNL